MTLYLAQISLIYRKTSLSEKNTPLEVVITTIELVVSPSYIEDSSIQKQLASQALGISADRITSVRVRKRSIDARSKNVIYRLQVEIYYDEPAPAEKPIIPEYKVLSPKAKRVVIIGAGPAGMFAALRLIELGIKPIILERGKDVRERRRNTSRRRTCSWLRRR